MTTVQLSPTYFGPIQWYQKLCRYDRVLIDCGVPFQKQSYQNRCIIAGANGLQGLTVPVCSGGTVNGESRKVDTERHETREEGRRERGERGRMISEHGNWRHVHWQALCSAYGDSPFFLYYADDLRMFFEEHHWQSLFDLDMAVTGKICELLDIRPNVEILAPSNRFTPGEDIDDLRLAIHPKHPRPDFSFTPKPYYQVFARRHGFQPNLSILDLLFNMGNESVLYL
ncbi:MAG: WbqC family protein [Prevotella sp.]|nr:WbqC family protein [Prevotella sp.]